jgi:adenylate cyclase
MIEHKLPHMRRRLTGESAILDFDVLKELADQGYTDYLAFLVQFDEAVDQEKVGGGIIGSWCTDRDNGFTNEDILSLQRIQQRIAVAFKINIQKKLTENILAAYLGPGAGRQVMNGQIRRGDGATIRAVIWFSDMRESTRLADTMSAEAFLRALNEYFESTAGAVLQRKGEVLRFIGDAVLAIFPIQDGVDVAESCQLAMEAARMAEANITQVNKDRVTRGEPALDFGLGLHVGEVLFGNIGVPERVEFSVVGPAANEVARLESLTKTVNKRILASKAFVDGSKDNWTRAGEYELRGVSNPIPVYTPSPEAKGS